MARPAFMIWAGLAMLAAGLSVLAATAPFSADPVLDAIIRWHGVLPRVAISIIAGAALGLSGLLLQRVLRNPLAEPTTLGISSGAQLALVAATLFAPKLLAGSREPVAFAGGIAAVTLVLALTWRRGLQPVSVVLAGMMITLVAGAASAALILGQGQYMMSLFIWGGGALGQQSWGPALGLLLRLVVAALVALLLLRPLAVLGLDDAAARGLGLSITRARLAVVAVATALASSVVAEIGIIGFVGLAAPALARTGGARTPRQMLLAAPLIGAVLLWLTDGVVQCLAAHDLDGLPTGAATALLGAPLLLWLLPRLRMIERPADRAPARTGRTSGHPPRVLALLGGLVLGLVALGLALGRSGTGMDGAGGGLHLATGALFADLLPWRLPRLAVAAAAGAMLAAAGTILQRVTANPLASPDVLGVGAGAGLGLAVVLLTLPAAGMGARLGGAAIGAVLVLGFILWLARRSGFAAERLLLAGLATAALCNAVLIAVVATGGFRAFALLGWLSGSTAAVTPGDAWMTGIAAVVLILPLALAGRWLALLPLGPVVARAAGLDVGQSRMVLVLAAALLTAAAALQIGPLGFVGLIAPHAARLLGLRRPLHQLAGAVLIGVALMVVADWLARMAAFPYQLPVGLFASILGGPYLIWLLGRGRGGGP
ncbi:Fe(3+)-hydroxamate ABC transporter permease FhuB [Tistrella sp. BH-R2-4]|uniref:Fe(3+)-hydroxamate ABC transporter permease FhuB n=1 Tax=Tistrella arctica TaxID=3133430 RepID=A0ABU9YLR7_9PROT